MYFLHYYDPVIPTEAEESDKTVTFIFLRHRLTLIFTDYFLRHGFTRDLHGFYLFIA